MAYSARGAPAAGDAARAGTTMAASTTHVQRVGIAQAN